jgi:hypothetical protein
MKKRAEQEVYVGHLHHYSRSAPMIWDPKTKLVSPQFHVVFDDNFKTVQPPNRPTTQKSKWTITSTYYSKPVIINMMTLLAMNTHTYFTTGE